MSDYYINVFYSDDDRAYVADIPDLEACSALGSTAEEPWPRWSEPSRRGWPLPGRR
jgi:hypothetical protein